MSRQLNISLSPHIHGGMSTQRIMWLVVASLIPALVIAFLTFGVQAIIITVICIGACLLTEWVITHFVMHRPPTLLDGSAMITGILLAFNLPSILPWWMAIVGSVVAIGIGKMSFGGLGCNIWNPALVGRVFLLISFPAAMTTWPEGVGAGARLLVTTGASTHAIDANTGATMLQLMQSQGIGSLDPDYLGMMIGNMNGSLGEVGSFAILAGLVFLLCMRVVTWHIPVAVLGSAAFFSWVFGGNPILDLFAGGLILGACYMATDYVTSPMSHRGQLIFGFFIGFITIIIRRFGSYPEGVSFAILLMNSFVPLINRYCRPQPFGEKQRREMLKKTA
ncbi:MAG: RnfABCDGE type electron transport complex subunit D [Muribaculaceae bacterium]|nr:RnfABCDGE type electron transport complex subunit D [Muribaculaceae bacterium]